MTSIRLKSFCFVFLTTISFIGSSQLVHSSLPENLITGVVYDPNNPNDPLNIIIQYCIQHADRVAAGENVIKDLVGAGLVGSEYESKSCSEVQSDKSIQDTFGPAIHAGN